ncbi:Rhodanese domain protein [Desulfurella amilsii]|uniref:Rhodanese domain protein n=1 Tax=Desulfurella amilsii TaxID=1562698 RepID=A0A1X4XWF4_9BACT|nr:rhodanese-like domain-containing protein [Desulfurella amilsii]OSS41866.1 Rhodanese domain protein [Desulfurella amilsii]
MKRLLVLFALVGFLTSLPIKYAYSATALAEKKIKEAKTCIHNVSVQEAKKLIKNGSVILDAREYPEYAAGHIPGAIWAPRGLIDFQGPTWFPDKNKTYLTYCKTGGRGVIVAYELKELGYDNVVNLDGGFDAWERDGEPIEKGAPEGPGKGIKK